VANLRTQHYAERLLSTSLLSESSNEPTNASNVSFIPIKRREYAFTVLQLRKVEILCKAGTPWRRSCRRKDGVTEPYHDQLLSPYLVRVCRKLGDLSRERGEASGLEMNRSAAMQSHEG